MYLQKCTPLLSGVAQDFPLGKRIGQKKTIRRTTINFTFIRLLRRVVEAGGWDGGRRGRGGGLKLRVLEKDAGEVSFKADVGVSITTDWLIAIPAGLWPVRRLEGVPPNAQAPAFLSGLWFYFLLVAFVDFDAPGGTRTFVELNLWVDDGWGARPLVELYLVVVVVLGPSPFTYQPFHH